MAQLSEPRCVELSQDFFAIERKIAALLPTRDKLYEAREFGKAQLDALRNKQVPPSPPNSTDTPDAQRGRTPPSKTQLRTAIISRSVSVIGVLFEFRNAIERQKNIRALEDVVNELNRNLGDVQSELDALRGRMEKLERNYELGGCRGMTLTANDPALVRRSRKR